MSDDGEWNQHESRLVVGLVTTIILIVVSVVGWVVYQTWNAVVAFSAKLLALALVLSAVVAGIYLVGLVLLDGLPWAAARLGAWFDYARGETDDDAAWVPLRGEK